MGLYGDFTEDSALIVEILIISEVKSPVIPPSLRGVDYRDCPTTGAHLAPLWPGRGWVGHNIDRYILSV